MPPTSSIPWAQLESLDGFIRALRDRSGRTGDGDVLTSFLLLVAILLVVWLVAHIVDRTRQRRPCNSPGWLLWTLCRAHGLDWSQWLLLRRIARHEQLEDPGRLFLEPERLDVEGLGTAFALQRSKIQLIRNRIFSDLRSFGPTPVASPPPEPRKPSPMPLFPPLETPKVDFPAWPSIAAAPDDPVR